MECMDSLGGSVEVLAQIHKVLLVEVLDGDLMVEGVHVGVLHDGLDPFFLGELDQFTAGGGIGEIFCRGGEEEMILDVLEGQGLDEDGFGGGGEEWFCPSDDVGGDEAINQELWNRATPCESHSISVGKKRWLSPPSRMEMWLEWDEMEVPVDDLHLGGTGMENSEPLLRSSSIAESLSVFPFSFSLISEVRITLPSPA